MATSIVTTTFPLKKGSPPDFGTLYSGRALEFDGVTDYIDCGSDTLVDDVFDGGGSLSAWIYPDSAGGGTYGRIITKGSAVRFEVRDLSGGNLKLFFNKTFSGTQGYWTTDDRIVPVGSWSYVVVTYDSDAVGNNPIIYVNGVSVALTEGSTPVGTRTTDASSNLYIGNVASGTN